MVDTSCTSDGVLRLKMQPRKNLLLRNLGHDHRTWHAYMTGSDEWYIFLLECHAKKCQKWYLSLLLDFGWVTVSCVHVIISLVMLGYRCLLVVNEYTKYSSHFYPGTVRTLRNEGQGQHISTIFAREWIFN